MQRELIKRQTYQLPVACPVPCRNTAATGNQSGESAFGSDFGCSGDERLGTPEDRGEEGDDELDDREDSTAVDTPTPRHRSEEGMAKDWEDLDLDSMDRGSPGGEEERYGDASGECGLEPMLVMLGWVEEANVFWCRFAQYVSCFEGHCSGI